MFRFLKFPVSKPWSVIAAESSSCQNISWASESCFSSSSSTSTSSSIWNYDWKKEYQSMKVSLNRFVYILRWVSVYSILLTKPLKIDYTKLDFSSEHHQMDWPVMWIGHWFSIHARSLGKAGSGQSYKLHNSAWWRGSKKVQNWVLNAHCAKNPRV